MIANSVLTTVLTDADKMLEKGDWVFIKTTDAFSNTVHLIHGPVWPDGERELPTETRHYDLDYKGKPFYTSFAHLS
jgi:hypothetical protein